jgi:hypothetical protein
VARGNVHLVEVSTGAMKRNLKEKEFIISYPSIVGLHGCVVMKGTIKSDHVVLGILATAVLRYDARTKA